MLLPKSLKKGDKIGFFSPSSAATNWAPKRFLRAKKYMETQGYELVAGSLTGKIDYYRSGNIQERASEFNALIRDPSIRCIISVIGGSNSNSLLPYIDYESLAKDPKIIIGYSDMTAILLGIYSKLGLVTYYGPALVASFGELGDVLSETLNYFEEIVSGLSTIPHQIRTPEFWTEEYISWEDQNRPKEVKPNKLITLNPGQVTGRLIVGNLNTMQGIYGSDYMPEIKQGDILVIEDSLKSIDVIERSFAHLKLNGVFDKIGGLVLGKHELFKDGGSGRKPYEVLREVMGELKIPVIAEYDCCHTHPMITLPIGIKAELNTTTESLTLLERWID